MGGGGASAAAARAQGRRLRGYKGQQRLVFVRLERDASEEGIPARSVLFLFMWPCLSVWDGGNLDKSLSLSAGVSCGKGMKNCSGFRQSQPFSVCRGKRQVLTVSCSQFSL